MLGEDVENINTIYIYLKAYYNFNYKTGKLQLRYQAQVY